MPEFQHHEGPEAVVHATGDVVEMYPLLYLLWLDVGRDAGVGGQQRVVD